MSRGSHRYSVSALKSLEPRPRQITGAADIEAALRSGTPIGLVLIQRDGHDPVAGNVAALAERTGIRVRSVSASALRRLSNCEPPATILALVGAAPATSLGKALGGAGATWLLAGVTYPGNAGVAIRTAEVSGADAVIIDAAFSTAARRFALRTSVRSDWYMPVLWERAHTALDAAITAGRRIVGIEHVGPVAPWEIDLAGRPLFVIGGERHGISADLLARCQDIVRIPMAGFIPSYNLQAAMAAIAVERLRQLNGRRR
jgi:TrmH family RNA methyltransferase